MERIGIVASKIAKGNLLVYNSLVIVLSLFFSVLIFVLAGTALLLSFILLGYIVNGMLPQNLGKEWTMVVRVCMIGLTVIVAFFNLAAVLKNLKISKPRS